MTGRRMAGRQAPPAGRLLGDTVVVDDVGPAHRGRTYPAAGTASILLMPVTALILAFVAWPVVRTVQASVTGSDRRFVGLANFHAALAAEGAGTVVVRTVLWALVVPAVVTALGYVFAVAGRRSRRGRAATLVLVAPIALPMVVTGVTFRLWYDPDPGRGVGTIALTKAARLFGVDAADVPRWLGPELVTVALMSAFVWAWVGLAIVAFRAALQAIPQSLPDVVRVNGGGRWDVFGDAMWRPMLRRTVFVVFAMVAVATARTFDLILVMTPGSAVDDSAVLAVRIWQTSGAETSGPAAALGVIWLGAVAIGAIGAALLSRQSWPSPSTSEAQPADAADPETTGGVLASVKPRLRLASVPRRAVSPLAALVWAVPVVGLLATSLHRPGDAAIRGWWSAPAGLDSYRTILDRGMLGSLLFTGVLAVTVTMVVLVLALPAAYALGWLLPPGAPLSGLPLMAAALVPVQVIAGPLNEVLDLVQLTATPVGLGLVHVALGLPFAVLVLRNGLADVPAEQIRRARLTGREWTVPWRIAWSARPTALFAVGVLEFVQVWNDFVVGLLFAGAQGPPLGLLLFGQARQFVVSSGPLAAGCVLGAILPVTLVVVSRRRLISGLVSGAIK